MKKMRKLAGIAGAVGLAAGVATMAPAQWSTGWSVGAPGDRAAKPGLNRYAFLVMASPPPGREQEFDSWYDMHQGDMSAVAGWTGSQRFKLADGTRTNEDTARFRHSYLVWYDLDSADAKTPISEGVKSFQGGRTRIATFLNHAPGAETTVVYRMLTARIARPDGKGATFPVPTDYKTPRPNRFLLAEFVTPAKGVDEAVMLAAMKARTTQLLAVPGFNGAQILRAEPTSGVTGFPDLPQVLPTYLTLWEIEAPDSKVAEAALISAEERSSVKALTIDLDATQRLYWEPIRPYVTRENFAR